MNRPSGKQPPPPLSDDRTLTAGTIQLRALILEEIRPAASSLAMAGRRSPVTNYSSNNPPQILRLSAVQGTSYIRNRKILEQ